MYWFSSEKSRKMMRAVNLFLILKNKCCGLQYIILHKTITCRKKLYDMKLVDSPNIWYCNNIDDIRCFLLSCETTRNFSGRIE